MALEIVGVFQPLMLLIFCLICFRDPPDHQEAEDAQAALETL